MPLSTVTIFPRKTIKLSIEVLNFLFDLLIRQFFSVCFLKIFVVVSTQIQDKSFCVLTHFNRFVHLHTDFFNFSSFSPEYS
jgi:hypothetical protein